MNKMLFIKSIIIILVSLSFSIGCQNTQKININSNIYKINFNQYRNKDIDQFYNDLIQKPDTIIEFKENGRIDYVVIAYSNNLEINLEMKKNTSNLKQAKIKDLTIRKYINSEYGMQRIIYYKFD